MSKFELGLNPLWLLACVLVALGFSLFLYFRYASVWSKKWNTILSVVRFVGVFFLLFLLLNPILRSIENFNQKPKIQVLIDNSESIVHREKEAKEKVTKAIAELQKNLKNTELEIFTLDSKLENLDSLKFDFSHTDLAQNLKNLENISAGENHVATVVFSDGIVNQGPGLKNISSSKPIYAIGMGDSTSTKDLLVRDLFANKTSFKGNEFPVQASVQALGFKGKSSTVLFKVDGQIMSSKSVNFTSNNELLDFSFTYTSKKSGYLKISCEILPLDGELLKSNNSKSAYIQVKESRKKVAFIAAAPHPDIKAIKSSIELLDNYEVDLIILSLAKKNPDLANYDAFLLHQFPCKNCSDQLYYKVLESKKPRWIIAGIQTDIPTLNRDLQTITFKGARGVDEVGGMLNSKFELFSTEVFDFGFLKHASPLKVPYAEIDLKSGSQVLFYQTIGTTSNEKPLFVFNNTSTKEFLSVGEGIWKWKLFESLENGNTSNFDLLVSKIMGLIDANESDSQFEVKVQKENYLESEKPSFSISIKNEIGELVYDPNIEMIIKRKDTTVSKTSFKVSSSDPFYRLNSLKEGVYSYFAKTKVGNKELKDQGVFSVSNLKLEDKELQADFDGLRSLASQSKGEFFDIEKMDIAYLSQKLDSFPQKIYSNEQEKYFNDLYWVLFLILLIFSLEWIARKLLGDV